jgi:transcriptional regulator with XRE-family HTH domain
MVRNYKELRAKMSAESRGRAEEKTKQLLAEMALNELREARKLTQEQLAERFHVKQPAIAKLEKRTDMYLSTLRRIIHAMGGELDIRAVFPDGIVRINQFEDLQQREQEHQREHQAIAV